MAAKSRAYNFKKVEKKWQKRWKEEKVYEASDHVKGKKNFYHLVMFPYPSGNLHIGHWYNFAPADVYARVKRMEGYNVMSPIGFDAFGLPAENAAIKHGIHPEKWTMKNIKTMTAQLESIGSSYDWSRMVITSLPNYYRWNQWFFLELFKNGLAYRKKAPANWCPRDKTVLANEQVVNGTCERCGTEVVQKEIDQWLFKITDYAERLLRDLDELDWPERTKTMQRNWIGKSEGARLRFELSGRGGRLKEFVEVFTTRPDTLFGVTYLVLAPEHPLLQGTALPIENREEVEDYIHQSAKKTERERLAEGKSKTGIKVEGIKALHPITQESVPVWVADYVLASYGTGAVMAVPAHDERDFEFAKKYHLPVQPVIVPAHAVGHSLPELPYLGEGVLIHSGTWSGTHSREAQWGIVKAAAGVRETRYRLRDWLISRQRYWGTPIPIVYCPACGTVPVPEKKLPVLLPPLKDFKPAEDGRSPLARSKTFVHTTCPACKGKAERETDTMDTFVDSSWYYFRYTDPANDRAFARKEKMDAWLPVTMYVGGAEHTVLHLLYSRFFTKFLRDRGRIGFAEPFGALRHQGTILGPDGQKMSKSKGNVVDPDNLVNEFGADAVRTYLCFMGEYDQGGPWNAAGILGVVRFLHRVWEMAHAPSSDEIPKSLHQLLHKTIKKVGEDAKAFRFNTAVAALMILLNAAEKEEMVSLQFKKLFIKLLAPFAPHLAEEIWREIFGHIASVHLEAWPHYEESLLEEETITLVIQVNGRVRGTVEVPGIISKQEAEKRALQENSVKRSLQDKKIQAVIFVPRRLINFVVEP